MLAKFIHATLLGLVGATIVHLIIVFMLPSYSANSSWSFISGIADPFEPTIIDLDQDTGERNLFLDPLFRTAMCRFDLNEGAVQMKASGKAPFWSLSVFDPSGVAYFSANDRIANNNNVDLAIVNQLQLRYVRQNTPDILAESIVAPATSNLGYVLLRVFAPDKSWITESDEFLSTLQCERLDF